MGPSPFMRAPSLTRWERWSAALAGIGIAVAIVAAIVAAIWGVMWLAHERIMASYLKSPAYIQAQADWADEAYQVCLTIKGENCAPLMAARDEAKRRWMRWLAYGDR